MIQGLPRGEKLHIRGDLNDHVVKEAREYNSVYEVMGREIGTKGVIKSFCLRW